MALHDVKRAQNIAKTKFLNKIENITATDESVVINTYG
jgi:hypothetical protein